MLGDMRSTRSLEIENDLEIIRAVGGDKAARRSRRSARSRLHNEDLGGSSLGLREVVEITPRPDHEERTADPEAELGDGSA
jgi:hypothetical protein